MQRPVLKSIDSISELYFRRKSYYGDFSIDIFSLEVRKMIFFRRCNHGCASWPPQHHQSEILPECPGDYGLVLL